MAKNDRGLATVNLMIDIYYDKHEDDGKDELKSYVKKKLAACPHGDNKPFCSSCKIHCYDDIHRQKIRKVMKYSGPRMIFKRPKASLDHLVETIKSKI